MRREVVDLVEAARGLKLTRTGLPGRNCVRVGLAPDRFAEGLEVLQVALEAVDSSGALRDDAQDGGERLRGAIDSLFRWMKLQGIDVTEPNRILVESLEGRKIKLKTGYVPMPSYAPNAAKKNAKWKPKLRLGSDLGDNRDIGAMSQANHSRFGSDMQQVVLKMGDAAPRDERPRSPADDDEAGTPLPGGRR